METELGRLYARSLAFVRENADAVERLARRLVEAGIVGGREVRDIVAYDPAPGRTACRTNPR